jgi:hypothetical protein
MDRFYRVQAADSDPEALLRPDAQVSEPWDGGETGPCDKCDGTGRTEHECESCRAEVDADCPSCNGKVRYERECPACQGSGRIDEPARRGVSVFPDEDGLYRYLIKREGRLEGRVLVVLEGELSEDEDVDADEGALLVRPRAIVEVRDVDMAGVQRLRAQLEAEAA